MRYIIYPAMIFELLFLAFIGISKNCGPKEMATSFSQCINGTQTVLYYWTEKDCNNSVLPPVYNISCKMECHLGTYLGINQFNQPECLQCPPNTYSTGNILRFSDHDYNFNEANDFFETHCIWKDTMGLIHQDERCKSWHSSIDNTYFQVDSHNESSAIFYQALIHPDFVREGYIHFRYKTNFPTSEGSRPDCAFIFEIDNMILLNDTTSLDRHWKTKSYILNPGRHEIYFGLYIHRKLEHIEDLIRIDLIEIFGTLHQIFECTPCKFGFSSYGSSVCSRCQVNQYFPSFKDHTCLDCPISTFAPPGSIGLQSCISKPICSIYDYSINDTKCIEETKSINFLPISNSNDSFCTSDLNIPSHLSFPCGKCNPGFSKINGECKACQTGYYSNGTSACSICPENTYSTSEIYLKYLDVIPEFIKNYCVNHDPYIEACNFYYDGWKLINNSFVSSPNLVSLASLHLEISMNISNNEGQFEFIFESNCTSMSFLLINQNSKYSNIDLTDSGSVIIPLQKGDHIIKIIFYTLNTISNCSVKIYNIRITEVAKGVSRSCNKCPNGYYSNPGSHSCSSCSEGYARLNGTKCVKCPENFYRDRNMNECQKCPSHTIPSEDRRSCILYDSYELNNNYMFNIFKFDIFEKFSNYESAKHFSTGGFFGPIFFDKKKSILYLSPTIPRRFSNDFYEFEEESNFRNERSYAFVLLHINSTERRFGKDTLKDSNSRKSASYYRVIKSFGTEIGLVNFTQEGQKIASITYVNGDKCPSNPQLNYSFTIDFACNKAKNHFSPKIMSIQNCHLNILWESPFACSECKYNETLNYTTSCLDGTRYTYLEEGPNCIINFGLNGTFNIEKVDRNKNKTENKNSLDDTYTINFLLSNQVAREEELYKQEYRFAYYDTIVAGCIQVRISFFVVLCFLGCGLLVIIVAVICAFAARRYRWNYFSLKEEAERLQTGVSGILPGTTVSAINLQMKESSKQKEG